MADPGAAARRGTRHNRSRRRARLLMNEIATVSRALKDEKRVATNSTSRRSATWCRSSTFTSSDGASAICCGRSRYGARLRDGAAKRRRWRRSPRQSVAEIPRGLDAVIRSASPKGRRQKMLDQADDLRRKAATRCGPCLDFQEHLADLEARGLLVRIDHPVDKDTELHPLVRLQFIGGIPEASGAPSCSPTWSMPAAGATTSRSWSAPSRPRRRSTRSACGARSARSAPPGSTRSPIRSRRCGSTAPPCQEVVITGDASAGARRRHEALPGADLDARLRFRALSHRHALHHQGSGNRHPEHRHLPGGAQGHRPAGGPHGGARRPGRRLSALAEIPGPQSSRCRSPS